MQNLTEYPVMNPTFDVKDVEASSGHAKIVIEPLEKGYGHTLGNALRRVLLTSLPGCAITHLKIDGVEHQFATLEGMTEDAIELILNLKQVRIKSDDSSPKGILRLSSNGGTEITAADIDCEAGFEIVNPEQKIAVLAKGKVLEVEMIVDSGVGYVMATEMETDYVGQIAIDALFSPIIKVSYKVEATRVGRRTDYDQLVLDVTTDGTVAPIDAVKQAAEILVKQFSQVANPILPEPEEEEDQLTPEEAETLRLTVEELDLPTRIANALRKGGFATVGDLTGTPKSVVTKVKNLGEKSVDIINQALGKKGVSLED